MKEQILYKCVDELVPYENNPRNNKKAVDKVAKSIAEFGFKVPIVVDENNVIVAGHTRLLASKQLGLESVPVIVAKELTDEQIKAFRLADNKVSEFSKWDNDKLREELEQLEIDMTEFGFEMMELLESEEEPEPEIKFTEELGEESNYIVLKFDTSVDWLMLESLFDLPRVHALGSKKGFELKGVGRVVDGIEFIETVIERGGLHE